MQVCLQLVQVGLCRVETGHVHCVSHVPHPVGQLLGALLGGLAGFLQAGRDQVWSLTQFHSVYFSQSRAGVKKSVVDGVLGPLRLARQT